MNPDLLAPAPWANNRPPTMKELYFSRETHSTEISEQNYCFFTRLFPPCPGSCGVVYCSLNLN
ncbi:UNVERIFIED_CONTAM: hypothetical protein FKN15_014491 [Acipenser sinensis]